ncbi:MAG: helix-turn-helix domain-containing protein [Streptosporangiaceae bacterium]|nr:helix-turn-helix domain-containing protein [Streptosporangiaceae bacterium]
MTGPAGAAVTPDAQVAAGGKGFKAELDALRDRMRALEFSYDEIAAEIGRRYRVRPRQAYRLARGWSLEQAAARFNERAARQDADPDARASLIASRLSEVEHWPRSSRKPSVYVLFRLAELYETDVLCLLDLADHESLPQQDRLVLMRRPRAATPFGEKLVALMEARGLSAAETARRVACSAGYLCNVIHGRKRPSRRVAARLDDLLEAGGELAALAETAEVVTGDGEPAPRGNAPAPADSGGQMRAGAAGGLSLALPYVPGRLVIEVSGPAWETGQVTGDAAEGGITSGRLALVRGSRSSATAGTEVTGA